MVQPPRATVQTSFDPDSHSHRVKWQSGDSNNACALDSPAEDEAAPLSNTQVAHSSKRTAASSVLRVGRE